MKPLGRRDFLRLSAVASALAGLGATPSLAGERNGMPYRILGETGEKVSIIGVGGYHLGFPKVSDGEAIRIMRTAVDEGVNFFDNAYIYQKGRSERLMGDALRDGYRDKVFLMTKFYTDERDVAGARKQLEESLRRLKTDVIDLWQVHQIHRAEHPRRVYENELPAMLVKAKEEGKIRHFGFTGHTRPEYLQEMIDRGFAWETVQMPVNPLDHHFTSFQNSVMRSAIEKKIAVIAMKTLGGSPGQFVNRGKFLTVKDCLHYTLNLPVATVVSGMDSVEKLRENLAIARAFKPLDREAVVEILAKCEEEAKTGQFEPYKQAQV